MSKIGKSIDRDDSDESSQCGGHMSKVGKIRKSLQI
jgi:hypothetical protein